MHSGALPPTARTRLRPRQRSAWLFPRHCQRSSKQPHDGADDLQKKAKHLALLETTPRAEASCKRPCTPINSTSGQKDFPHLPLPRADSSLHHTPRARQTSLAQTNLFPLADSAHHLETIWQKQSSKQCRLRKILLPATSTAPLKLAAHTLFSALSIPPHATLTSAPATLALCPCLRKERHSESLGLALPSVPCRVLLKLPLLCFLCLRLPCLALPTTCWLCFALPTTLALAFHAGKALQSKCRQLWASQGRGKQGQSSEGKANGVVGKRRPSR